jgi:histone acetyltransferase (RNA polymerase elongator complex component)
MLVDIEELNNKFDRVINRTFKLPSLDEAIKYTPMIQDILTHKDNLSPAEFQMIKRKHKFNGKNSYISHMYEMIKYDLSSTNIIETSERIRRFLKVKKGKSQSGVLVVTIFTSPYPEYYDDEKQETVKQEFTCKWNCHYCPNEQGQPRSYLKGEPGVMRANRNDFDCIRQMHDRMKTLYTIGHPVDKLEVIVLGGTWESYPLKYREMFCRDMYYAANIFGTSDEAPRAPLSLTEEKIVNKTARCKVIGLTLETRPDTITPDEVKLLRFYGCTRVQLGMQHTDDDVLIKINRRCTNKRGEEAIKLLKDTGFKVDSHWMPNLPGSSPKKDNDMFIDKLLGLRSRIKRYTREDLGVEVEEYNMTCPDLQVDQWKVYPCSVVPWTQIEQWYKDGSYIPYNDEALIDVLINLKTFMFPWIRLNRIIRDIPADYIMTEAERPNMRQDALDMLQHEGKCCMCIRCREVKDGMITSKKYIVRKHNASDGIEFFISAESKDAKTLYGFARLRLPSSRSNAVFKELNGCAFIRELHVYGQLQVVGDHSSEGVQHTGIGKHLIHIAESLAKENSYRKMAIIAGEGTKGYYEKLGYLEDPGDGGYMIKYYIK